MRGSYIAGLGDSSMYTTLPLLCRQAISGVRTLGPRLQWNNLTVAQRYPFPHFRKYGCVNLILMFHNSGQCSAQDSYIEGSGESLMYTVLPLLCRQAVFSRTRSPREQQNNLTLLLLKGTLPFRKHECVNLTSMLPNLGQPNSTFQIES